MEMVCTFFLRLNTNSSPPACLGGVDSYNVYIYNSTHSLLSLLRCPQVSLESSLSFILLTVLSQDDTFQDYGVRLSPP